MQHQRCHLQSVGYLDQMLIELIERIRGVDRWPSTEAIVISAPMRGESIKGKSSGWTALLHIQWKDGAGAARKAVFRVRDGSPLFQLYQGQLLAIRYDPRDPASFYIRAQFQYRASRWFLGAALVLVACALEAGVSWLRAHGLK
jgi:hypothetical protein